MKPFDRCDVAPRHGGADVLPNFFLFSRLVRWAHKPLLAVRDLTFGFTATYTQLLTDVLALRNHLQDCLDPSITARLEREDEVFMLLLGPGGYEFTVGFLALLALGAVIVPISPDLPVKEATYFATKSQAVAVVVADRCAKLGRELQRSMTDLGVTSFASIAIRRHIMRECLSPKSIIISSDKYMDLNRSGYGRLVKPSLRHTPLTHRSNLYFWHNRTS